MKKLTCVWIDGLVVTLMREGVNKHRAREIAQGYWEAYCKDDSDVMMSALQEADTIMGHDDAETEWRDKWAGLWSNVISGAVLPECTEHRR